MGPRRVHRCGGGCTVRHACRNRAVEVECPAPAIGNLECVSGQRVQGEARRHLTQTAGGAQVPAHALVQGAEEPEWAGIAATRSEGHGGHFDPSTAL
jgi:hypothetical protein